jgi:hypothetical protein
MSMKERPAATTLRQVFAHVTENSEWSSIADNDVARVAVRAFVQEARANARPFRDVIMKVFALIADSTDGVDESTRATIEHWVVEVFYPLYPQWKTPSTTPTRLRDSVEISWK